MSFKQEDCRKTVSNRATEPSFLSPQALKQFSRARVLLHTRLMYANHKPRRFNKRRSADRILRYTRETIGREDSKPPLMPAASQKVKREEKEGRRK